ncbi:MAG: amino acid permease [Planctomycetota bacterium]|nr:amino acid permease [Planctomycetota bacterium]
MTNPQHPGPDGSDAGDPTQPKRSLGTFDATCIVIGAIIGVGIFFTPSKVAALTHSAGYSLIAWSLSGFIALCGALAFAWLGQRYRANGAQYEILRDAYGPLVAFVFVFCNCTAVQAGRWSASTISFTVPAAKL